MVNANKGMYKQFLEALTHCRVIGLTATPYRLASAGQGLSMLKFLTRTRPKVFQKVVYYIQNKRLFDSGFLSPMKYFHVGGFDRSQIKLNTTGADFDERSLQAYYKAINLPGILLRCINRLIEIKRKRILVFVRFIREAEALKSKVPGAIVITGETPPAERDRILRDFKAGKIQVLINIGVLTTGFDDPGLDTILLGRETMSLALYYQMIGRGIRPHPEKEYCMVVDCCGNFQLFGKLEELTINQGENNKWFVSSGDVQLTNVPLAKSDKNIFDQNTQISMAYGQNR